METSLGVAALVPFRDDPIAINPSLIPPLDNYYPIPSALSYSEAASHFKSMNSLSATGCSLKAI
jgi:hypothetical protein